MAADPTPTPCYAAELVLGALLAYPWPEAPRVLERRWLPTVELEEAALGLTVHVAPMQLTLTPATDQSDWHDVVVDVGLLRKLAPGEGGDDATLAVALEHAADAHVATLLGLADWFRSPVGRLPAGPGLAAVTGVETPTLLLREHLVQLRQLSSVLRLTVRVRRAA